ncbi:MAG: GNAT family N-acetyltransferase [Candidatus Thorarchaeota archaeon]
MKDCRGKMTLSVREANSWDEFKEPWIKSMRHLPWYNKPNQADYIPEIELKELESEFDDEDHYFLLAVEDDESIKGVLEFKCYDTYAANGIVMPGVPLENRNSDAARLLFEHQQKILRERNIPRVVATLKYRDIQYAKWYLETLESEDFIVNRPESVQMIAEMSKFDGILSPLDKIHIKFRNDFNLDEFTEFTIKSYASTPEDLSIHGWDRAVTEPDTIRIIHKRTMDGVFGHSPSNWWKVAILDENPVGYIIGFHIPPRSRGVIGNLGVFPEYRKRGIAVFLIQSMFQEFKDYGLQYVMVGTPSNNTPAIRAYTKAGFQKANYLTQYLREIQL